MLQAYVQSFTFNLSVLPLRQRQKQTWHTKQNASEQRKGGILMNAYLIAAKANAWEVSQHVGYAIEANQPEYLTDAQGRGAGCDLRMKRKIMARPHLLKDILRMSQQSLA